MATGTELGCSREDEYETHLLGFCSKDVCYSWNESIQDHFLSLTEQMKVSLLQKHATEEGKALVEEAMNGLKDVFFLKVKATVARWKELFQSFFDIPPHVLLPEDKMQRNRYSDEDERLAKEKLFEFQGRYKRAQFLKAFYKQEIVKAKMIVEQMRRVQEEMAEVESCVLKSLHDNSSKTFKKDIQELQGLEIRRASLRLLNKPLHAQNEYIVLDAMLKRNDQRNKISSACSSATPSPKSVSL